MRSFDLSPLFRSTIGFDPFADVLNRVLSTEVDPSSYPPYNIEKTDENHYRISVAVAGFKPEELSVEVKDHQLVIAGRKAEEERDENVTYLHRGIAQRAFEKRFQLAEHVQVTGARHENGMLHVELVREIPEALKPRRIEITSGAPAGQVIEGKKAASEKAGQKKVTEAA
ncbi:MAG: heat-shock protein [Alphaproteobacteria bacterium]|nr:MAG: heat-shock protein [Alphaproteobacteria bacterium]